VPGCWAGGRQWCLPGAAEMRCIESTEQPIGEVNSYPAAGDLPRGPYAGGKWSPDTKVLKEAAQSHLDGEQGTFME